jgi:ABC-type Fe3+ transport system permease subunit/DNA-binding beta-propeller fold protein YncE
MNWFLLKNSLLVSGLATLLAASFGLLAALWLAGLPSRFRNAILALAVIALALPPFLVTNTWLHFLGQTGVWRVWLPFNMFSLGGTVWILSLLLWPITLLAVFSSWQKLEPAQLESDPAVAGWALLRVLLLPLARPALAQASLLTFVLALNNFAVPAILQVKVFPAEMWVRYSANLDMLGALRLSLPLLVTPLLLLLWLARRGFPWPRIEGPLPPKLFRQQLGAGWFRSCGACTTVLCLLAVGLPLFQIISVKRTWTELPGALAAGQSAVWNSLRFAALSATIIIAFSLFQTLASRVRRSRFNPFSIFNSFNHFLARFFWLPFLVPGVLLGIALIALFNNGWFWLFYQSAGIVILAFVIRYLALGWNAMTHALSAADSDLTDAAHLSGATRWQMLRHVHWPQIAPQVSAAWYIVFLLCLWDVESLILVVPPGGETLALRIFNLLHYGHNAQVNALCLTLLGLAVVPLGTWKACCLLRVAWERVTQHATRNTASVRANPCLGLAACLVLLLAGCTPPYTSNQSPIQSQLFDRVQIIGTRGAGVGQLNKPRSVAVDLQDNLYVVDMTGRVQKFSPDGVFQLSWQMPQTDLGKPKGMCRDREGNIIVVEPHYQRVNHFSTQGRLLAQWGERGTNTGQFTLPRAVAVNSRNEIFVSEYGAMERIQKFQISNFKSPHLLDTLGTPGNAPGEFNRPEGLCVDSQNRLYVADSCNHRIQVFSSDGTFLRAYGKAGSGKGELSYPYDICVDAAGRQYVCEFGNSRIQVFDANDQPLEIIGGPGAEPNRFSNPWGVALDSAGNLYVADSQNHRVQKFIRKGSVASSQRSLAANGVSSSSAPFNDHEPPRDRGLRTTD